MRFYLMILILGVLVPFTGCRVQTSIEEGAKAEGLMDFSQEPTIRVLIVDNADQVILRPDGAVRYGSAETGAVFGAGAGDELVVTRTADGIELAMNDVAVLPAPAKTLALEPLPGTVVAMKDIPFGEGWSWEDKEDRLYDGVFNFFPDKDGDRLLDVVLELKAEEYLRGVVPYEIGPSAPMEALKAQAVAARSETITALRERIYAGDNYDICSDVMCQVYAGLERINDAVDTAVRETRGMVIAYQGESLPAYYAGACGGYTENIENVWPDRDRGIPVWNGRPEGPEKPTGDLRDEKALAKWIASSPSVYCNHAAYPGAPAWTAKNFRWEVETSAADLSARLKEIGHDVGRVTAIEPVERGVSGRLVTARFVGTEGSVEIGPELEIRRVWSPYLKSACFIAEPQGPADRPASFLLKGAGNGHGVGMCQTGAMGRALSGQTFDEILTHYYQQTEIMKLYP